MKPLHVIQEKKSDLYKNLLLVVLLSAGVSLCANYFSNIFTSNKLLLCGGIVCICIVVVAYVASFYKSKSFVIKTDSLFVVKKDGFLLPINRYRFSEEMNRDLRSVFSENKTFEKMWIDAFAKHVEAEKKSPQSNPVSESKKNASFFAVMTKSTQTDFEKRNQKAIDFVGELIEYVFIDWLSIQQSSYFNSFEGSELETLTRGKIADYLLQNRVLEMISKPYEERENFINSENNGNTNDGEVLMVFNGDTVFNHFDLQLPKKSSMYKEGNKLVIKNRNYTLKFSHNFIGFNANLPVGFHELYLGHNFRDIVVYGFQPEIEIKLNPFFFLFWKDWKYMKWIDVVSDKFTDYFSFKEFVNRIGYETALTNTIMDAKKNRPS